MKSLSRLKLNQISKAELEKREMNSLLGGRGYQCCCGCDPTIGETETNARCNVLYDYTISLGWGEGNNDKCACWSDTSIPERDAAMYAAITAAPIPGSWAL